MTGIEGKRPPKWSLRVDVESPRQQDIPGIIIASPKDRSWVGGLIQGEGCVESHYVRSMNSTAIQLAFGMTDPDPIFKLCDLIGMSRPSRPKDDHFSQPVWVKRAVGLRALRILQEVLPYLLGEKLREAERAMDFFSPNGYHDGCFRPPDIWPSKEFPLRRRSPRQCHQI
ncbi:MAG: hypothetical protein ABSA72_04735 [Nitrososphaerales archaeon]